MDKNAYIYYNMYTFLSIGVSMNNKDNKIHKIFKEHKGFARTKNLL
jgi:hypothetical protein